MATILPPSPRRILIIKPSAIGDVVHTLPILNLLRRRWPEARIEWVVTQACAGILEGHPQLDEVLIFDRKQLGRWWRDAAARRSLRAFTQDLRSRRYDLVIDLQGLFRSGWLAWQTRCPARVGFANAREGAWLFYTHRIHPGTTEQHAIDRYLKLAQAVGAATDPVEYVFPTDDADRQAVTQMLGSDQPYAVLIPGTNWPTKRWPIEHFNALAAAIRREFGLRTVVAGAPSERELGEQIAESLNLCGRTTLRQLVALLERAAVVICNDSGPMHIATALGRPMVALFGPTNPVRTGPYRRDDAVVRLDISCSPCYSRTCSHQSCLRLLQVQPVLAHVRQQLEKHRVAS